MGIEQMQMAKIKALLPASWFNWSQIGVKYKTTMIRRNSPRMTCRALPTLRSVLPTGNLALE
jgi:hypothetical protein